MNKKIFARIISFTLVVSVLLASCLALFACDKNKPKTVEDIFKSTSSKSEFSGYKLEISLPAGGVCIHRAENRPQIAVTSVT